MPNGVLPPLPADTSQAAHSDEILVLDGNGEGAGDYMVADRAIKMLNQVAADPDKPFFVGCGFSKPHSPPEAPQRFYDLYDPAKIQLPPDFAAWPTVPPGWPKAAIRPRNADLFIGRGASEDEARQVIRAYLASISWVDWNLSRVIAELERLKLRENTVIVFVADHGYQLGENGKWSKAGSLFEGGTRVPLIIDAPGAKGNGRSCTRMVAVARHLPHVWRNCAILKSRRAWKEPAWSRCLKIRVALSGTRQATASGVRTAGPSMERRSGPSSGATRSTARMRQTERCSSTCTPIRCS